MLCNSGRDRSIDRFVETPSAHSPRSDSRDDSRRDDLLRYDQHRTIYRRYDEAPSGSQTSPRALLAVVRKAARDCILRLNWAPDYSDSTEAYPAAMNRPSDRNVGIPIPTTLPYGLGVSGRGEAELSS